MTVLEADITDLSHDGRGVAHIDGKAVFVTGALAGERVRLRFTGKHRHYDEAVVEEVLQAVAGPGDAALRAFWHLRRLRVAAPGIRRRRSRPSSTYCWRISNASARCSRKAYWHR